MSALGQKRSFANLFRLLQLRQRRDIVKAAQEDAEESQSSLIIEHGYLLALPECVTRWFYFKLFNFFLQAMAYILGYASDLRQALQGYWAAVGLASAILLTGCASTSPRAAVPEQMAHRATVSGIGDIRFWSDAQPENLGEMVALAISQRNARSDGTSQNRKFLVLSGGGSDGASGAGLLVGWTANGTRPVFDVVTGISTGAIIAPFAFLGHRYDEWLEQFYTEYDSSDILRPNWLAGLFGGSAIADSSPLERLIAHYITPELISEIAAEYRKGRRLLIGTTNLDAQRPVTWDMTAIAASDAPGARRLFQKVILASASVPLAFPPVWIDVTVDGKSYQELHVDGSVTTPVFFLPSQINLEKIDKDYHLSAERELYIIRNGRVGPQYSAVKDDLVSLTNRAFSTISKSQTAGELLRLCLQTQRDHIAYRIASIPESFEPESKQIFDRSYMGELFQAGYSLGRNLYPGRGGDGFCY